MQTHQGPWPAFVRPSRTGTDRVGAILHTDSSPQRSGAPPMLQGLSDAEVMTVLRRGTRRIVDRNFTIFSQGAQHDGIYLVETGRVRVFYTSPAGREVTLAYWHPGNFVGGPEVFGASLHVWTGVATMTSSILHLKADVLRKLITEIPALGIGVIEGLSFKGKCYSAMAQMLGYSLHIGEARPSPAAPRRSLRGRAGERPDHDRGRIHARRTSLISSEVRDSG